MNAESYMNQWQVNSSQVNYPGNFLHLTSSYDAIIVSCKRNYLGNFNFCFSDLSLNICLNILLVILILILCFMEITINHPGHFGCVTFYLCRLHKIR